MLQIESSSVLMMTSWSTSLRWRYMLKDVLDWNYYAIKRYGVAEVKLHHSYPWHWRDKSSQLHTLAPPHLGKESLHVTYMRMGRHEGQPGHSAEEKSLQNLSYVLTSCSLVDDY
jgi:hypothetical protein